MWGSKLIGKHLTDCRGGNVLVETNFTPPPPDRGISGPINVCFVCESAFQKVDSLTAERTRVCQHCEPQFSDTSTIMFIHERLTLKSAQVMQTVLQRQQGRGCPFNISFHHQKLHAKISAQVACDRYGRNTPCNPADAAEIK